MKKDVIYIDIEDDITSIIDKVHQAGNKIVALVPPKRVGVLQSAVNLKLLQKAADADGKRIVLITSDAALSALAAGVRIPVAKNLQSKPELAQVASLPEEPEDDDVIRGDELPVGELAKASAVAPVAGPVGLSVAAKEASDEMTNDSLPKKFSAAAAAAVKKPGIKVPNFDSFRKRLFLIAAGGVLLIAFLVWAIVFAPRATVTVMAKTNAVDIQKDLILDPGAEPDYALGRLRPEIKQLKKTATTEFDTTGSKEIGEKAKGTMTLTNAFDSDSITVPAGSAFTAATGQVYTSDNAVTVPGARLSGGRIVGGSATVSVTAAAIGPEYNVPAQAYTSEVEGITAQGSDMQGGSKETVKVVAQSDVDKATQQLGSQDDTAAKSELQKQFEGNFILIQESFTVTPGSPRPEPAVGERAERARLTVETTYTLVGVARDEVKKVLNDILEAERDEREGLRIYSSGDNDLKFSRYQSGENNVSSVRLNTTGYLGPDINAEALTKQLVGKRYGEIEQIVNNINGVEQVDIDFSPFWVNKAPSEDKITVKFSVKTDAN